MVRVFFGFPRSGECRATTTAVAPTSNVCPASGDNKPPSCPLWGSVRLTYSICAFISMTLHVSMRNMLGLVVLRMVKSQPEDVLQLSRTDMSNITSTETASCASGHVFNDTNVAAEHGTMEDLDWTRTQQLIFPGAFYYGYVVALPLAGWLSDRFGGKLLFINSLTLQSVAYLMLPLMAHLDFKAAVAVLVVAGFFGGCGNPPLYQLFVVWAHPTERTALLSFAYSGLIVGSMLIYPVADFLCTFSWELPFYVFGGISLIFGIGCFWVVYNELDDHPRLSAAEKAYLQAEQTAEPPKVRNIPWTSILTSLPVHAFILTHAFHNYGYIVLALLMPRILRESMQFTLKEVGILSSAPYFGCLISKALCIFCCGIAEKHAGSHLNCFRRLLYSVSVIVTMGCIIGIIYSTCKQRILVISLYILLGCATDLGFSGGYWPTLLYFAPSFAGLLSGLANSFAHLCGILAPYIVAIMVQHGTKSEWNSVLWTLIVAYTLGAIIFDTFSSSKLQKWDLRSQESKHIKLEGGETPEIG
ncbi:sialin [Scaptodrosophila lebanonensis]|uniref:Sialin n=1 Tax=Drosophila lebanonensis TaxID=7225 RepID=A0A6J2T1D1_DROLE|nr:sialin [Scaptodrosophila lebanonensis]